MEQDKCIEEIATLEEVEFIEPDMSDYVKHNEITDFIKKDVDDLIYYIKTTDLEKEYIKKVDLKEPFKEISGDNINVWELEQGNYVTTEKAYIYLQTGSSIEFNARTMITISDKEGGKKKYSIIDNDGHIYIGNVENDGTPEENGNSSLDITRTLTYGNDFEYEVTSDYNPTHKKYVDDEVKDCYYNLEKKINEENNKQTIVNIVAKDESYSQIMNVDSIDIEQEIPTVDVLSVAKGKEMNERIGKLEKNPIKFIELYTDISQEDRESHTYPDLKLTEDQLKIVIDSNISVLKVTFNITGTNNDSETSTLVFYTTIDNVKTVKGQNTVNTIKINATRTNDEGTIIYHCELMGNGVVYPKEATLKATYVEHNIAEAISIKKSMWE